MKKNRILISYLMIFLGSSLLTSCYRMPTDDDFCVVPRTNNPDVTREKGKSGFMPNMNY